MSEPVWVPLGAAPGGDPGVEVAYAEFTAPVSVPVVAEASAVGVVTAPAFQADGTSTYLIEFFSPSVLVGAATGSEIWFSLYLDGVNQGILGECKTNAAAASLWSARLTRRVTPAAGARTFAVRAFATGSNPGTISAGSGGVGGYLPGYIRITKIPSGVQIPTWTPQPVAVVTSLPASPVDGQEIILVDSLTAPTYSWHFKFMAAKASNKWMFVGGAPALSEVTNGDATLSTSYVALANAGPSFTVPVAGDYEVGIGCDMSADGSGGRPYRMSYDIGATGAADADAVYANGPQSSSFRARRKALGAGTLTAKYRANGATSGTFSNRFMRVVPIAVGG